MTMKSAKWHIKNVENEDTCVLGMMLKQRDENGRITPGLRMLHRAIRKELRSRIREAQEVLLATV